MEILTCSDSEYNSFPCFYTAVYLNSDVTYCTCGSQLPETTQPGQVSGSWPPPTPTTFLNSRAKVYDHQQHRLGAKVQIKCNGRKENPSNFLSLKGEFYSNLWRVRGERSSLSWAIRVLAQVQQPSSCGYTSRSPATRPCAPNHRFHRA